MASTQIVNLFDDLDSRIQNGVETVTFFNPLTGQKMEIELGEANRKHLENHLSKLEKYVAVARTVEAPKPAAKAGVKVDGRNAEIRKWAQAQPGIVIGDRGRIKADIVEAYDKAHGTIVEPAKVEDAPVKLVEVSNEAPEVEVTALDSEGIDKIDEPSDAELEQIETEPLTDDDIVRMMTELDAEKDGKVNLSDLVDKAAKIQ